MAWRGAARIGSRNQYGFTLLELTVVVCLISILVVIAVDRIWALRVEAERVAVAQVVGTIRSALGLEVAQRVVHQGVGSLAGLDGGNPMELLAQQPPGYLGGRSGRSAADVEPGDWYFDTREHVLVYRVRFVEGFRSAAGGDRAIYRLTLKYSDRDANGRFDPGRDVVYGLDLVSVGRFRWVGLPQNWWDRWF